LLLFFVFASFGIAIVDTKIQDTVALID